MLRTISVMVGKGSVSHNSRVFNAANTDPERSRLNRMYRSEEIREVYHELFAEALKCYNDKQARSDRAIEDYYEKICSGKQEKPFHEIILQIGNCDDMNAKTENGELAAVVLDEYMQSFEVRNPNMRVFSAHLHMDEATPHLHIDFIPYTTGSKRGLDTRVSLKQALAAQGFKGGTRQKTEWNQWVSSEKNQLAAVMERYGIEWLQKGTHEKHLSVLDFEKKMRLEEVCELEDRIDGLQELADNAQKSAEAVQQKLDRLQARENLIGLNVARYDREPEWQLPEPTMLMSASSYKTKIVEPFIKRLKGVIRSLVAQYLELKATISDLSKRLARADANIDRLVESNREMKRENSQLIEFVRDYKRVRDTLGSERIDGIIAEAKVAEQAQKLPERVRGRDRER